MYKMIVKVLITCAAVTVIAAAIAASDGLLPVMIVLAASTYVAGMANCGYSNKSCFMVVND
jgi:hypothetical protein